MIEMVAGGGSGTRSTLGHGWFLTTTVDQTPRDFSVRVWGHALNAFDGHQAKYSPTVRYSTINIRVGSFPKARESAGDSASRAGGRRSSGQPNPAPGNAFSSQLFLCQLGNETFEITLGEVRACVLQPEREILSNKSLSAMV